MALCCIGGVCVPYSAILPLMALAVKWLYTKLVSMGLIPLYVQDKLSSVTGAAAASSSSSCSCCPCEEEDQVNVAAAPRTATRSKKTKVERNGSSMSTSSTASTSSSSSGGPPVSTVQSAEEWDEIVSECSSSSKSVVVVKFTASWCRPCKAVQPAFESIAESSSSSMKFCVVDVDDVDKVASKFSVAVLPAFVAVRPKGDKKGGGAVEIDRYTGSSEDSLREFVDRIASTQVKNTVAAA